MEAVLAIFFLVHYHAWDDQVARMEHSCGMWSC